MSDIFQINSIQSEIGYDFKSAELLKLALTHISAASDTEHSNQGLSFLGRAVLELLVRDHLYSNYTYSDIETLDPTGSNDSVAFSLACKCGELLHLSDYVIISDAATAIKNSPALERELFLALSAAIYKDGGMPAIRAFLIPKLRTVISAEAPRLKRDSAHRPTPGDSGDRTDTATAGASSRSANGSTVRTASKTTDAIKSLIVSKLRRTQATPESPDAVPAPSTDKRSSRSKAASTSETAEGKPTSRKRASKDTAKGEADDAPQRSFIRDALTPIKLTDVSKTNGGKRKKQTQDTKKPSAETPPTIDEGENYKSALQEFVQKNVHSSTVMLEYKTSKAENGAVAVEVYLFDKKLSGELGASKKEASRLAARSALRVLRDTESEEAKWFHGMCADPTRIPLSSGTEQSDYVSKLNQTFQKLGHTSNAQVVYERIPASAKKLFAVTVSANGKELGRGEGSSVKEARQNAAKAALDAISRPTLA